MARTLSNEEIPFFVFSEGVHTTGPDDPAPPPVRLSELGS